MFWSDLYPLSHETNPPIRIWILVKNRRIHKTVSNELTLEKYLKGDVFFLTCLFKKLFPLSFNVNCIDFTIYISIIYGLHSSHMTDWQIDMLLLCLCVIHKRREFSQIRIFNLKSRKKTSHTTKFKVQVFFNFLL